MFRPRLRIGTLSMRRLPKTRRRAPRGYLWRVQRSLKHRVTVPRDCPLSVREFEVLRAAARHGGARKTIARELYIEPTTVRSHLSTVYRRLGVCELSQAVLVAVRRGWLDLDLSALPVPAPEPVPESKLPPAQQVYLEAFDVATHARDGDEHALEEAKYRTDAAMVAVKPEWVWSRSVASRDWMDRLVEGMARVGRLSSVR